MPLSRVPSSFTGTTRLASPAANTVAITTSSAERLRVNSSGNVGIGTNNPVLGLLDINGAGSTLAVRTPDTSSPTFALFVNAGSNGVGAISLDNGGIMTFDTGSTGAGQAERMRITSGGDVGIGTTSPASRLNILGTSTAPSATTLSAATLNVQGSSTLRLLIGTDPSSPFGAWLQTTDGAGAGYPINLNPLGGNVGIGTSSPTVKLAVVDTAGSSLIRAIGNASGTTVTGQLGASSSALVAVGAVSNHPLIFTTNDAERARILTGGSLCVNNTTSAGGQPLYVKAFNGTGSAGFQVFSNGNGAIDWYNGSAGYVASVIVNASSVAYNTTSDYRLKENIAPMTGALAKVSALKPVTYDWKSGGSSQGFIAHELQEVVPDCVTGEKDAVDADGKPKYQGVDTSFLVATLTAAIQEQQAIIASLTSRIEALENQ
jgi:hypothetical protein